MDSRKISAPQRLCARNTSFNQSLHSTQTSRVSELDVRRPKKDLALFIAVRDTVHMKAITYTAARENLADTMQRVCEDHAPVVITRRRDQAVVMMALEDYDALEETAYLLRSPRNAKRLREAVDQLREGKGTERKLPVLE